MTAGTIQPPDTDIISHLDELAAVYRHRQRILEVQRARFGPALPSHIQLEYEDVTRDLVRTLAELRRLRPTTIDEQAPYVGLSTFQETDADRFFGRDALIAALVAHIEHSPFLAVLGASGSGKSSVVRAGLIPALKGGILPGSEQWQYLTLRPGPRPLNALATALTAIGGGTLGDVATIRATLRRGADGLLLAVDTLRSRLDMGRLVLVVDQAEELWTLTPAEEAARQTFVCEEQRPLLDLLLTTAAAPDRPIQIVLTMRADFLHRAAEHVALARAIAQHDVIVSPMTAEELKEAIVRPAEVVGATFEPGLVEALLAQTIGRDGALPLLEYTLLALWNDRRTDGTLTWDSLHRLGGVEGGLARRADATLEHHYSDLQRERLRAVLLRLIQPGEGAADARRRVALIDLTPIDATIADVQALLQPLVDARLLTSGHDAESGAETIELAHEALICAWPTLQTWIAEARADLRLQLQLEAAAQEWAAHGESPDFLWSGLRLANTEAWIERVQPRLNRRDQAFLDASLAERERVAREEVEQARQRRRGQHFALATIAVTVLIIGILAMLGFDIWQSHARIIADGERTTRNLAHVLEEQTARTIQAIDLTILSIKDTIILPSQHQLARDTDISQLLREKLATLPYIRAIFVIDADGYIIYDTDYDTDSDIPHVSLADRGYFKAHQNDPNLGLFIGSPLNSRSVNKWFISMSRRFNKPDGSFGGVIVVAVEPQYFERFYDTINVGRDGSIAIFKRDGTLMVRNPPADSMMGKSFTDTTLFRDYLPNYNGPRNLDTHSDQDRCTHHDQKDLHICLQSPGGTRHP